MTGVIPGISIVRISVLLLFFSAVTAAVRPLSETTLPDALAYSRRVWQSADGLPEDFAQALARTRDGYLWIGAIMA